MADELKKFYMTLGQAHCHRVNGHTIDKDCVPVIKAIDYSEARKFAFLVTDDGYFHQLLTQEEFDKQNVDNGFMKYFPRGLIEIN